MTPAVLLLLQCLGGNSAICPAAADAVWMDENLAPFAMMVVIAAQREDLLPKGMPGPVPVPVPVPSPSRSANR